MISLPRSSPVVAVLALALVASLGRSGPTSTDPIDSGARVEALLRQGAVWLARVQADPDCRVCSSRADIRKIEAGEDSYSS